MGVEVGVGMHGQVVVAIPPFAVTCACVAIVEVVEQSMGGVGDGYQRR